MKVAGFVLATIGFCILTNTIGFVAAGGLTCVLVGLVLAGAIK